MSYRDELLPAALSPVVYERPSGQYSLGTSGFGQTALPHIETQQARYGGASHIYLQLRRGHRA